MRERYCAVYNIATDSVGNLCGLSSSEIEFLEEDIHAATVSFIGLLTTIQNFIMCMRNAGYIIHLLQILPPHVCAHG